MHARNVADHHERNSIPAMRHADNQTMRHRYDKL